MLTYNSIVDVWTDGTCTADPPHRVLDWVTLEAALLYVKAANTSEYRLNQPFSTRVLNVVPLCPYWIEDAPL